MKLVADSTATGGGKVVGTEVTNVLHAAGISFGTNARGYTEFVVCDPGSKRKYRGDSALHLIKADTRLLMLFTNISRGELPGVDVDTVPPAAAGRPGGLSLKDAMRKAVYDAQKDYFLSKYNSGDFGKAVTQLGPTWHGQAPIRCLLRRDQEGRRIQGRGARHDQGRQGRQEGQTRGQGRGPEVPQAELISRVLHAPRPSGRQTVG
jgi:hypothetical protein